MSDPATAGRSFAESKDLRFSREQSSGRGEPQIPRFARDDKKKSALSGTAKAMP